jgi:hypothetical protein
MIADKIYKTKRCNIPEIVGKKFGKLTVLEFAYMKNKNSYWKCLCECGREHITSRCILKKSNNILSCGCSRIYKYEKGETGLKKVYERYKNSCKRENKKFDLTLAEFKKITSQNCTYCGAEPERVATLRFKHDEKFMNHASYKYNGIDRTDSTKGYEKENIVPCCHWCNIIKRERTIEEFKNHVDKIYQHLIIN